MRRMLCVIMCAVSVVVAWPERCAIADAGPCDEKLARSLFVSVIQEPAVLESREAIVALVDFAKRSRISRLFVQVYRANRAWFPSVAADSDPYRSCVAALSEDPLALLIREAHAAGIEVHAWMNMLSLAANADAPFLRRYGPTVLTRNRAAKTKIDDYKIDDQFFLEPGDPLVRQELCGIVEELLVAYPALDGIQFDYIRYPDKHPAYGYTDANLDRFLLATGQSTFMEGSPAWSDWKRSQVTGLLEQLAARARLVRPDIRLSATGCAPFVRAYHEAFQDWPLWLERGLVDFVTIMSYSTDADRFGRYIDEARSHAPDFGKVVIGIGAYEMVRSSDAFARQMELCRAQGAGGCAIFHYGSVLEDPAIGALMTAGE